MRVKTYYSVKYGTRGDYQNLEKRTMRSVMRLARKVLAENPNALFVVYRFFRGVEFYGVIVKNGELKRIKGWQYHGRLFVDQLTRRAIDDGD